MRENKILLSFIFCETNEFMYLNHFAPQMESTIESQYVCACIYTHTRTFLYIFPMLNGGGGTSS